MGSRKRSRLDLSPSLPQWLDQWSMIHPSDENLSVADKMVCRWVSQWYQRTGTNDMTDLTLARLRWHAIWSLQQWGLSKDASHHLVQRSRFWDLLFQWSALNET